MPSRETVLLGELNQRLRQFASNNRVNLNDIPDGLWLVLTDKTAQDLDKRPLAGVNPERWIQTNQETAEIYEEKQLALLQAWHQGNLDPEYVETTFAYRQFDPWWNLLWTIDLNKPLILRPRTTEEIMMDFPLNPNPDNSRCIPIGQTVSFETSQPLWINPQQNTDPVLLIGPETRRAKFLQIMSASAKLTNGNLVKIWEEESAHDFLTIYADNDKLVNLMYDHKYNLAAIPAAMSESISPVTNVSPFFHFWITANSAGEIPRAYQRFLHKAIIFPQDTSGPKSKQFAKNGQIFWELTPTSL